MSATERPAPEEIVLYDKDPATKIATITFNRPDHLNAPTSAARLRYADLLRGATVDDDVKVVVIRGVGEDLGSGADLPDFMAGTDEDQAREGHPRELLPRGLERGTELGANTVVREISELSDALSVPGEPEEANDEFVRERAIQ